MRLIRMAMVALVCLFCLFWTTLCVAQGAAQKSAAPAKKAPAKAIAREFKWETLGPGAKILRLSKPRAASVKPEKTEVVILLLTDEVYTTFKENPEEFINKTYKDRIFPGVETTVEKPWKEIRKKKRVPGDEWAVVLGHDVTCITAALAVEDF